MTKANLFKYICLMCIGLFLGGCSTMHSYIKDFPELEVKIHDVSFVELQKKCWGSLPWYYKVMGGFVGGCADINFNQKTCDIYLSLPTSEELIEHEKEHCRGGDHDGIIQAAYDKWRKGTNIQNN